MKIADTVATILFFMLVAFSLFCFAMASIRKAPDFTLYPEDARIISEAK